MLSEVRTEYVIDSVPTKPGWIKVWDGRGNVVKTFGGKHAELEARTLAVDLNRAWAAGLEAGRRESGRKEGRIRSWLVKLFRAR